MSKTISFDVADVNKLVEQTKAATSFRSYFDSPAEPALWLVGDEGVYLMSNRVLDEGVLPDVVFAKECPRDDYDAKRYYFGGDDGVEAIPLAIIEAAIKPGAKTFFIELGDQNMGFRSA